jgi:hypothetical protein
MTERAERPGGGALREVCLLIGRGDVILWSDASASPVWLPDSRARWEAIWHHRAELTEIVHSHPVGPLAFSAEDETTMAALGAALGAGLGFAVVAPGGMIRRRYPPRAGDGLAAPALDTQLLPAAEPWWAALLRLASGMRPEPEPPDADLEAASELPASPPKTED